VSYETPDDFLLDLDPARRRRRLREEEPDEKSPGSRKVPDADQGRSGVLMVERKLSPDAFLAMVTDAGRRGGDGVQDEDYYRTHYGAES
jgi:hypothetical protein